MSKDSDSGDEEQFIQLNHNPGPKTKAPSPHLAKLQEEEHKKREKEKKAHFPHFEHEYELLTTNPDLNYTKITPLGTGSFGTVWRSLNKDTNEEVAVKTIKETTKHDITDLKKEIGFLIHCQSEFVCKFYEGYAYDKKLIMVIELFQAGSVHDMMKMAHAKFSEDFILEVATQTLLALEFLQSRRVIHRDIKAGNLLAQNNGQVKLCDFGVSRLMKSNENLTKTIIGTPYWMPPEFTTHEGYTFNADIWSLGITMIEINDGNPPYHRIDPIRAMYISQRRPPPKFFKLKNVSEETREFLAKVLVKERTNRPFAHELLEHELIAPIASRLSDAKPTGSSKIVAKEVIEYLPQINTFREETPFIDDDDIESDDDSESSESEEEEEGKKESVFAVGNFGRQISKLRKTLAKNTTKKTVQGATRGVQLQNPLRAEYPENNETDDDGAEFATQFDSLVFADGDVPFPAGNVSPGPGGEHVDDIFNDKKFDSISGTEIFDEQDELMIDMHDRILKYNQHFKLAAKGVINGFRVKMKALRMQQPNV